MRAPAREHVSARGPGVSGPGSGHTCTPVSRRWCMLLPGCLLPPGGGQDVGLPGERCGVDGPAQAPESPAPMALAGSVQPSAWPEAAGGCSRRTVPSAAGCRRAVATGRGGGGAAGLCLPRRGGTGRLALLPLSPGALASCLLHRAAGCCRARRLLGIPRVAGVKVLPLPHLHHFPPAPAA